MWSVLRTSILVLIQFINLGILVLSIHLSVARWPLASSSLTVASFANSTAGEYDVNTGTFNVMGIYVSTGAIGAALTFSLTTFLVLSTMYVFASRHSNDHMRYQKGVQLHVPGVRRVDLDIYNVLHVACKHRRDDGQHCVSVNHLVPWRACMEVQALQALLVAAWLFLVFYFLILVTLAFVGVSHGCDDIFQVPAFSSFFHHRKAQPALVVEDSQQERGNVASVLSPPAVQPIRIELQMSTSTSWDKDKKGGNQGVKPASVAAPHPRAYHKPFLLADDEDGGISDIVLDEDVDEELSMSQESLPALVNPSVINELIAGSVGGAAQVLVGQPLDTIKTRAQIAPKGMFKGPMDVLFQTVRKEGFFGLYKGMASPLMGIAAVNSLLFAAYNVSKRAISPFPDLTLPQIALAGSMAGAVNSVLASPVELFKIRMQGQYGAATDRRLSRVFRDTWSAHGFKYGVMRGFWATVAREIPAYGAFYTGFEFAKRNFQQRYGKELPVWALLSSGSFGGVSPPFLPRLQTPNLHDSNPDILLASMLPTRRGKKSSSIERQADKRRPLRDRRVGSYHS
ncbi:hypothetical protein FRC17_011072 [Serendipita sp. 399]|nr:hypothetical protein FRC17_011072 [Serendipita sp. 399]